MIPNHFHIVEQVLASGGYDLDTHDGLAEFLDAAVAALHKHDKRWVHIKKKPGQKNIHGHAEDAALYLLPDNKAQGCDFVKGAGALGATLRWGPDPEPYYKHEDGWDAHGDWSNAPAPAPQPPAKPVLPGRQEMMEEGRWLDWFYSSDQGLQRSEGLSINGRPDWEGVGAWLFDVYLNDRVAGKSSPEARAHVVSEIQKTEEWKAKHP